MDIDAIAIIAGAGLAALALLCAAALRGWERWLAVRAQEIEAQAHTARPEPAPVAARIELADLRERIRRLEAIAAGVDL